MSGEQEIYPMIKLEKHPKMAVCLEKLSPFLGKDRWRASEPWKAVTTQKQHAGPGKLSRKGGSLLL